MYIKDVIIDGFKCYSDKVIVRDLDKYFTAITGMNGSGKSNIIDAIIFCLDLNTSKVMRAGSLGDLINIHRNSCSVTLKIVGIESSFGSDKEITRTLTSASKTSKRDIISKFKINGFNATKASVEEFCKSIGVSSNLVVMQGHITKLLNIKPQELKLLIEETAGIKTYNNEYLKSKEMLDKKEFKLKAAQQHLSERINPFFDQILKEKEKYDKNKEIEENNNKYQEEYEKLTSHIEKYEKTCLNLKMTNLLFEYDEANKELEELDKKLNLIQNKENNLLNENELRHSLMEKEMVRNQLHEMMKRENAELQKCRKLVERNSHNQNRKKIYDLEFLKNREGILQDQIGKEVNMLQINELESKKDQLNQVYNEMKQFDFEETCQMFCKGELKEETSLKEYYNSTMGKYSRKNELERKIKEGISRLPYSYENKEILGTVDELFEPVDQKCNLARKTVIGNREWVFVFSTE